MIISSGENIYPVEIEEVLNLNPKVKDCIVTSVPDKMRGQLVTAYVVKADESLTAEELDEFCKESPEIANFKRPRYYRFVSSVPLNATGKKLHAKVKAIAADDLRSKQVSQEFRRSNENDNFSLLLLFFMSYAKFFFFLVITFLTFSYFCN